MLKKVEVFLGLQGGAKSPMPDYASINGFSDILLHYIIIIKSGFYMN